MDDFYHFFVTVPPCPSSAPLPPHAYTMSLPQRPFGPYPPPMHVAFPTYSFPSNCYSAPTPIFQTPQVNSFAPPQPQPPIYKSPMLPLDRGFAVGPEDRRASVMRFNLAPLTDPKGTIHIVVEENDKVQKFPVHRDLLCFYSPYFRSILFDKEVPDSKVYDGKVVNAKIRTKDLRREWRWEDKENVEEVMATDSDEMMNIKVMIKLPDLAREPRSVAQATTSAVKSKMNVSEAIHELKLDFDQVGIVPRAVFAAFVNWLYHGYAGFGLHLPLASHAAFDATTLIQLWVFAGRIGVRECQNHCIEGIEWWRMTTNIIHTAMLRWVYDNTEDYAEGECGLRALLIDQCAWKLDGTWLVAEVKGVKNHEQFPRQALVDMVSRMRVILNEHVRPPFENSEMRQEAYWVEVDDEYAA